MMENFNDQVALKAKKVFGRSLETHIEKSSLTLRFTGISLDLRDLRLLTIRIESFIDQMGWEYSIRINNSGLIVELETPEELQLPNIIIEKNTKEEIIMHTSVSSKRYWLHSSSLGVDVDAQKEKSSLYSGMTQITITPVRNFNVWAREDGFETLEEYLSAIQDGLMSRLSSLGSVYSPTKGYFRIS